MKYQIVIKDANGWGGFDFQDLDVPAFIDCMVIKGYQFNKLEDSKYLRNELIGQPIFAGLLGPMYNGEGCVRYENQAAYNAMSN